MKTLTAIIAGLAVHFMSSAAAQQPPVALDRTEVLRDFSIARENLATSRVVKVDPSWVLTSPPVVTAPQPEAAPVTAAPQAGNLTLEKAKLYQIKPTEIDDEAIWTRVRFKIDGGVVAPPVPTDPGAAPPPGPAPGDGLQSAGAVPIPGVYTVLATNNKKLRLKAYLLPGDPLRQSTPGGDYRGTFSIAVSDIDALEAGDGADVTFSAPITFKILSPGFTDPDEGSLGSSAAVVTINVTVPASAVANDVVISVRTPFDPGGRQVRLPLAEVLDITTSAASIEGFGVGVTNVQVSVIGRDRPEGTPVTLRADPSAIFDEGTTVKLDANGMGQISVRSSGIGETTLTATLGRMKADTRIDFSLPLITVIASLLGGLIGGGARWLTPGENKDFVKKMVRGVLVGVLVAALYIIGVNILPITPVVKAGPVVILALSGVAAFFGPPVFNGLKALLGGKPPPGPGP